MIFIAHRGNLYGPNPQEENKPEYLLKAIEEGFFIETDIWYLDEKLFLGHDNPQYEIDIDFLVNVSNRLFLHCKNIEALYYVTQRHPDINCFFHDSDDCVLTSHCDIWTFPGKTLTPNSICVMPERWSGYPGVNNVDCRGICTDYPKKEQHNYGAE